MYIDVCLFFVLHSNILILLDHEQIVIMTEYHKKEIEMASMNFRRRRLDDG